MGKDDGFIPDNSSNDGFVPDGKEVKKKEQPAPSSTGRGTSLTPAPSSSPSQPAQAGGFIQSHQWDVNNPSTSQPSASGSPSSQPAKQPSFVGNNPMTGTNMPQVVYNRYLPATIQHDVNTPDQVSGYSETGRPLLTPYNPQFGGPKRNEYKDRQLKYALEFNDKVEAKDAEMRSYMPGTQEYERARQEKLNQTNPELFGTPIAENYEPSAIDVARQMQNYALLNTNPDKINSDRSQANYLSGDKSAVDVVEDVAMTIATVGSSKVFDVAGKSDEFKLQQMNAKRDESALGLYSDVVSNRYASKVKYLKDNYGNEVSAVQEIDKMLSDFPKDADGNPVISNEDDLIKYNALIENRNRITSDPGYIEAVTSVGQEASKFDNIKEAQLGVIRSNPEYYKEYYKAQAKAKLYKDIESEDTVSGWVAQNVTNPMALATANFGVGLATTAKVMGDADTYGFFDELYDNLNTARELELKPMTPMSNSILAQTASAGTTMGLMLLTGAGFGAIGSTAFGTGTIGAEAFGNAGMVVGGFVGTVDGYYTEGIAAGMSEDEAHWYALTNASIQGALELINPEINFSPAKVGGAKKYLQLVSEGATKKDALFAVTKDAFKEAVPEITQEFMQQYAEWGVNATANYVLNTNLDTGKDYAQTLKDTAIVTALISGAFGIVNAGGLSNKASRINSEAAVNVAKSPESFKNLVSMMVLEKKITAEKAATINAKIYEATEIVRSMPSNLSDEQVTKLFPIVQERRKLEAIKKKTDEPLKPKVEQQIAQVDEQIRKEAVIKTEEEAKAEADQKANEINEMHNLRMVDTAGIITEEQKKRLEELNAKYAAKEDTITQGEPASSTEGNGMLSFEEFAQKFQDMEPEELRSEYDKYISENLIDEKSLSSGLAKTYAQRFNKAKMDNPSKFFSVSPQSPDVIEKAVSEGRLVDYNGVMGIVTESGDIVGLFKYDDSKKGGAKSVISKLIKRGGVMLDNFDGYLTKIYSDAGFRVIGRVPFNKEYAPVGWSEEIHGEPDVVAMVYDPKGRLSIEDKTYDSYDDLMKAKEEYASLAKDNVSDNSDTLKVDAGESSQSTQEPSMTEQSDDFSYMTDSEEDNTDEPDQQEPTSQNKPEATEDDPESISILDSAIKDLDKSRIINTATKLASVRAKVQALLDSGKITQDTAIHYDMQAEEVAQRRGFEVTDEYVGMLNDFRNRMLKWLGSSEKSKYVTDNDGNFVLDKNGNKIPIVGFGPSITDVVNFAFDTAEKAIRGGMQLTKAVGNLKAALLAHPTVQSEIANGVMSEAAFSKLIDDEISKLQKLQDDINSHQDEKIRKSIGRVMGSKFVSQDVKNGLSDLGIDYVPTNIEVTMSDAARIVDYFEAEGSVDLLEQKMSDLSTKDVSDTTRGAILTEIAGRKLKSSDSLASEYDKLANTQGTPQQQIDDAKAKAEAAAKEAAKTIYTISNVLGNAGETLSVVGKAFKAITAMSKIGTKVFAEAQVEVKVKDFMQKKGEKRVRKALRSVPAGVSVTDHIKDQLMPGFDALSAADKKEIDDSLKAATDVNGKIKAADANKIYENYLNKAEMGNGVSQLVADHNVAVQDLNAKMKSFDDLVSNYKSELAAVEPGSKAYKDIVNKYDKLIAKAATEEFNSRREANKATENLSKKLRASRDIWTTMSSLMKGGMLSVNTVVINLAGYIPATILRGANALLIASPVDIAFTYALNTYYKARGIDKVAARSFSTGPIFSIGGRAGASRGLKLSWDKIRNGQTAEEASKYDMNQTLNFVDAWRSLWSKKSPAELNTLENKLSAGLEATIGIPADYIFRFLNLGDKVPYEIAKYHKLAQLAQEQYVTGEDGKERKLNPAEQFEFIFRPDPEALKIADDHAKEMTYQQDNKLSEYVAKAQADLGNMISKNIKGGSTIARHVGGAFKLLSSTVVPFTKTPINFLMETIMFTNPYVGMSVAGIHIANSVKYANSGDHFKATYHRGEAIKYIGRSIVSMAIAAAAAKLIKSGMMTGDDDNAEARQIGFENIRKNSLNASAMMRVFGGSVAPRAGDVWINYEKMGTVGLALASWAEFYKDRDNASIDNGIMDLMSATGGAKLGLMNVKSLVDQSFMTGIANLMDAIRDNDGSKFNGFMTNTMMALSSTFIPNTLAAASKASMSTTKETKTEGKDTDVSTLVANKLRVNLGIFGTADALPDKVTLWGDDVKNAPEGTDPWVYYMFSPVKGYTPDTENFGFKLQQLYFSLPKGSKERAGILPSKPTQDIVIGNTPVVLTADEYHDYQVEVGKTRKEMLASYMTSPEWDTSTIEEKAAVLSRIYEDGAKIGRYNLIMSSPRLLELSGWEQ